MNLKTKLKPSIKNTIPSFIIIFLVYFYTRFFACAPGPCFANTLLHYEKIILPVLFIALYLICSFAFNKEI